MEGASSVPNYLTSLILSISIIISHEELWCWKREQKKDKKERIKEIDFEMNLAQKQLSGL